MYNYRGIDYLEVKPDAAYKNIITFIQNISDFKRSTPSSLVVKAFFDAKYQELAETFRNYQDKSILQLSPLSTPPTKARTWGGNNGSMAELELSLIAARLRAVSFKAMAFYSISVTEIIVSPIWILSTMSISFV